MTSAGELLDHPGVPGCRRRVLVEPEPGRVRASVEDDFHHFIVEIEHRDGVIIDVKTQAPRYPWTTCPEAGRLLADKLCGLDLDAAAALPDPLSHCTHLYDLALIAAAHATEVRPTTFSAFVGDAVDGRRTTELRRDGAIVLDWPLEGDVIAGASALAGRNLRQMRDWLPAEPPEIQEAARILRRTIFIAGGRGLPLDDLGDATFGRMGACFTFHPERASSARRMRGSVRDFTYSGRAPLEIRSTRADDAKASS